MALKYLAGNKITGLAADTKPTTVPEGSFFTETDTKKEFIFQPFKKNLLRKYRSIYTKSFFKNRLTMKQKSKSFYSVIFFCKLYSFKLILL